MKINKEIVLELYAAFDRGDFDLGQSMLSEDFVTDLVGIPTPLNRAAFIKFGSEFRQSFPDGYHQFEHVIAEDDRVGLPPVGWVEPRNPTIPVLTE